MNGFRLHPEAYTDLDDVWEYVAANSIEAAAAPTLPRVRCVSYVYDYLIAYAPG